MTHTKRTLTFLLLLLAVAIPASAQVADGAEVDKTAWWNRANQSVSTPVAPVPVSPPTGVPEGRLAVSSSGPDQTNAVAGIGIRPDANPGATITEFTLTIAEDPDAPGNQGTASPAVVIGACPIVEFWGAGESQSFESVPEIDCTAANATGSRDEDGVWTFDLTAIGNAWLDPFGSIRPDGVLLLPEPENPSVFQAVLDPSTIEITFLASGGDEPDNPFAAPTPTTSTTVPSDVGFATPGISGGGTGIIGRDTLPSPTLPTTTSPPATTAPAVTTHPAAGQPIESGTGDETAAPTPTPTPISEIGNLAGNLPGVAVPGIVLFVAVLLAMSYYLGPNGQPEIHVRQRGVSRALDASAAKDQS